MSKRMLVIACFGIPVIVILGILLAHVTGDPSDNPSAAAYRVSHLESAALPKVLPVFLGTPSYDRKIVATATIEDVDKRIDKCDGPVAVPLSSTVLVAQHDYCGGSDWIGRLKAGQAVTLSGPGVQAGTYVADELKYERRGEAKVSDLPIADLVLQTCVSKTKLVLIGMHQAQR